MISPAGSALSRVGAASLRTLPSVGLVLLSVGALGTSARAQSVFVDKAAQAGVLNNSWGRAASTADFDNDGLLDLVTANVGMDNGIFRQRPNGTFEQADVLWGVPQDTYGHWSALAADLDDDGDQDLYFVSGGFKATHPNQLLRNDIDWAGTFTDITGGAGDIGKPGKGFGTTALDYDRDGLLDVFVSNGNTTTCDLFHNDGSLIFSDVGAAAGIDLFGTYRHCGAGDVDNDGWPDIGVGHYKGLNRLYHNQKDGTFVDIAAAAGVAGDPEAKTFGFVFEDFDNDGWMDCYLPAWNLVPGPPGVVMFNNGDMTFGGTLVVGQYTEMGHTVFDLDHDGFSEIYIGTGAPSVAQMDALFSVADNGVGGMELVDVSVPSGIQVVETRNHGMACGDYDQDGDIDVYVNNGGPSGIEKLEENFLLENQGTPNHYTAVMLEGMLSNSDGIGSRLRATAASGRQIHRFAEMGKGFGNTNTLVRYLGVGSETQVDELFIQWPSGIQQTIANPPIDDILDVVETGMRATGTQVIGSDVNLDMAGPPGFISDLFFSTATIGIPLPELGGTFFLGVPLFGISSSALGASGVATQTITLPNNPNIVGVQLFFQAWIHDVATLDGSVLSNLVTVVPQ